jgi:hypothetical protein
VVASRGLVTFLGNKSNALASGVVSSTKKVML